MSSPVPQVAETGRNPGDNGARNTPLWETFGGGVMAAELSGSGPTTWLVRGNPLPAAQVPEDLTLGRPFDPELDDPELQAFSPGDTDVSGFTKPILTDEVPNDVSAYYSMWHGAVEWHGGFVDGRPSRSLVYESRIAGHGAAWAGIPNTENNTEIYAQGRIVAKAPGTGLHGVSVVDGADGRTWLVAVECTGDDTYEASGPFSTYSNTAYLSNPSTGYRMLIHVRVWVKPYLDGIPELSTDVAPNTKLKQISPEDDRKWRYLGDQELPVTSPDNAFSTDLEEHWPIFKFSGDGTKAVASTWAQGIHSETLQFDGYSQAYVYALELSGVGADTPSFSTDNPTTRWGLHDSQWNGSRNAGRAPIDAAYRDNEVYLVYWDASSVGSDAISNGDICWGKIVNDSLEKVCRITVLSTSRTRVLSGNPPRDPNADWILEGEQAYIGFADARVGLYVCFKQWTYTRYWYSYNSETDRWSINSTKGGWSLNQSQSVDAMYAGLDILGFAVDEQNVPFRFLYAKNMAKNYDTVTGSGLLPQGTTPEDYSNLDVSNGKAPATIMDSLTYFLYRRDFENHQAVGLEQLQWTTDGLHLLYAGWELAQYASVSGDTHGYWVNPNYRRFVDAQGEEVTLAEVFGLDENDGSDSTTLSIPMNPVLYFY